MPRTRIGLDARGDRGRSAPRRAVEAAPAGAAGRRGRSVMRKHILIVLALIVIVAAGFWFWISRPDTARVPVAAVMGARPDIGAPRDQWVPTVKVADAVGWKDGQPPAAAPGLAVHAFAPGLDHPPRPRHLPQTGEKLTRARGGTDG